jgi:hypothetical protein
VEGVASAAGLPLHAHLAEVRRQGPSPHSPKLFTPLDIDPCMATSCPGDWQDVMN